jgi:hypothetical protein
MRMTASWCDPHGSTEYKVVVRSTIAPASGLPLGRVIPTIASLPPCSGLSRRGLEVREHEATGGATAGLDSPCARQRPNMVGRDEETGLPSQTKKRKEESIECRELGA